MARLATALFQNLKRHSAMKRTLTLISLTLFCTCSIAQREKIDSLQVALKKEKTDSNKVTLMWNLAQLYQSSKPDSALIFAEDAHRLSKKIHFVEGESKSLNQIANAFNRVGNYPKALEYYIRMLKIEERRNNPENLAIAYLNIGSVYLFQEEFRNAIDNTMIADSIIVKNKVMRLHKFSLLNLGDIFEKYNKLDSAMEFSNKAYLVALQEGDENMTGAALNNLANICLKRGYTDLALGNYRKALPLAIKTVDEDLMCETQIGLARTFSKLNQPDSSIYYARQAFQLSQHDGFLRTNLVASEFLKNYFEQNQVIDSAYKYQGAMMVVKESISSDERVKEGQLLLLNEQVRQKEIQEQKTRDEFDLKQRLQYIGIGVLIPLIFLFTLYLRNKKIRPKYIEFLGLVSLLLFFEYITLMLHPFVVKITNHVPLFELLVFSTIAALLTRTHHKIENWFLSRLTTLSVRRKEALEDQM